MISAVPQQHTILLLEQDPPLRRLLADFLRREGYTVEEALDGLEAVRMLDEHRATGGLCLVLLNLHCPEVDGLGVLQHLARSRMVVPVVVISSDWEALEAATAAGARATLGMPFELEQLLAVLRANCGH